MKPIMRFTIESFILFSLFVVAVPFVKAQNEPVPITISTEKTTIDGKAFYLHTINPGETLYSISKAYHVSQNEIISHNPEASTTIRVGQTLKIPVNQLTESSSLTNSQDYIFHIAEPGQTIDAIAEKYNLSKDELIKDNPELEVSPLQNGQVVKIPKNRKSNNIAATSNFSEHKVKRKETLYSISRSYGVTVDEIIALNPELNTSDIKTGQTIKIPAKKAPAPEVVAVDTPEVKNEPVVVKAWEPCTTAEEKKEHKVAFLLPLYLEENRTVIDLDSISSNKGLEDRLIYNRSKNFIEFYEGALLAIDSLKRAGNSYKVYVYDTGRELKKLTGILNRKELSEMDIFIGPFDSTLVDKAVEFAKGHNIKVVSPLSQNINKLRGNPNLFQVNPAEFHKIDAAIQYLSTQKDKNIILVKSNRHTDDEIFKLFEAKLNLLVSGGFHFKTHTGSNGSLSSKLVTDKENIIIMPSNEEAAVSDLLRNVNYVNSSYRITVFGLPRWTTFSNTDINYLHNLQFEYYTSFFADYSKPVTKLFILKMRNNFHTEPEAQSFTSQGYNFAFLGYDISFYFLSALAKYGKDFENCLPNHHVDLIQSNLYFSPVQNGDGTMNSAVSIIKYNKDYTITKVR